MHTNEINNREYDTNCNMWLAKTADEMRAAKAKRRLSGILLLVMSGGMSFYLAAISPLWHGQRLGVLLLPIPQVIPAVLSNLAAVALALAACYWLTRSPAYQYTTLICQKCHRLTVNAGQTQCDCGGAFSPLYEMKWVDGHVRHQHRPPQSPETNLEETVQSPPVLL
jgi:hypothetical protein